MLATKPASAMVAPAGGCVAVPIAGPAASSMVDVSLLFDGSCLQWLDPCAHSLSFWYCGGRGVPRSPSFVFKILFRMI
jgi:hypothetical protein